MADINTLIFDAQTYAQNVLGQAMASLNGAFAVMNNLGNQIGGPVFPVFNVSPPAPGDPGDVPQYNGKGFVDPGLTTKAPTLRDVPDLDLSGAPGTMPSVVGFKDPGNQPTGDAGDNTLLGGTPTISPNDILVPVAPDMMAQIQSIQKPTIVQIRVPTAPAYAEPAFLGKSPDDPAPPPQNLDTTMRAAYTDISPVMREAVTAYVDNFIDSEFPQFRTGLAKVEARLDIYLSGGTALVPAVDDAILSGAQSKSDAEYRRARDGLYEEGARMGHTVLGPTLVSKAQQIDKSRRDANTAAVRERMVKVYELEQQNMQFAVTQSANLRGVMINAALGYFNGLVQINGQALEYARSIVDAIVRTYELAARHAEIQARIYESEAQVFDAKVKGALGVLEAYNAEVRGLEAQANVDRAMVDVYRSQVEAIQAEAMVYRAQVDAALAKAQIARLQVEVYQARVQAYGAQVNAYTARWGGYRAAVEGQIANIQASAEQVRGFEAQSRSYQAIIGARVSQIDGLLKVNEGNLREYTAQVEAYGVRVRALAEVNRAQIESFDATIKSFIAKANAISEHSRAEIAQFEAALRAVIANAEMAFRLLHERHDLDIHRAEGIAALSTAAAHNYTGLAQSAMSGMNTLVAQVAQQ